MNNDLVRLTDVSVELGGNAILKGVSAGFARGKSYSGRIEFHCGHDHSLPTPQHVGYVPQKLRIEGNLPLTVCDLLALTLQRKPLFFGVGKPLRRRMEEMLKRVWTEPALLERPVEKLSGGELQRVLLGLALQPQPELLLLDEPAAGVDFQHDKKFYELIAQLNETTGVTILLVSHELSVVSRFAHHILCLRDGCIQCQGPPERIGEMLADTFGEAKGLFQHQHSH
jgi:zinc transport system ATP-binding protein